MSVFLPVVLDAVSFGSYLYLYDNHLKESLLNQTDRQDGFSTKGRSNLGYSFWLMTASSILSVLALLILVLGILRRGKTKVSFGKRRTDENEPSTRPKDAPGMMMY